MTKVATVEIPICGMDCSECALHVQHALEKLPGVASADVLLSSEKAIVRLDPTLVGMAELRQAVADAGYSVPASDRAAATESMARSLTQRLFTVMGLLFGAVLLIVVVGEWLGVFEMVTELVPFWLGAVLVVLTGWPIFRNVVRSALKRQVTSHTLMTLGVLAALAVGQWATAAVVVFFMRVGDYVEHFTTEASRRAVKSLTALAPQTARVEQEGAELELPIAQVQPNAIVIVRPGEKIPVDGTVLSGHATVDQAAITGESMPVEVGPGAQVFAATLAQLGSIRVRTLRVGAETTFGRVVKLVEEAEANRAEVQRFADKFSAYYLPVVATLALLTLLISRDPLATTAVLVVACSCSIALATPVAMLASVGAAARQGLLVKGGKYLELLARADVLLIDKTGTLTLGQPQVTDVTPLNGMAPADILTLAATAERYSEHPLAEAVRAAARIQRLPLGDPEDFVALPGLGVRATVSGQRVAVGSRRLLTDLGGEVVAVALEQEGKTLLYVTQNDVLEGIIAAADTLRPEVPAALAQLRTLGIRHMELLTGDNERTAADLARRLGVAYRANLLPEDKIAIVKEYQAAGHTVVMVGDGVNDAPALAQADVGIAMGAAGADIALEAAHVALMREDWRLVPQVFQIARRTMRVVKGNLIFTAFYNVIGLTLAALGFLPPILAAAAQSLPDLLILGNSARLIKPQALDI